MRRKPTSEGIPSVLNAAINQFVESANKGPSAKPHVSSTERDFIPASAFEGEKPGYYFSKNGRGLGYYLDPRQQQRPQDDKVALKQEKKKVDADELLKQAEIQAKKTQETLDSKSLKRLALAFERKYKENLEQRMKYADQPEKFMESEVELDESIQNLMELVNKPELYPVLVDANVVSLLLNLLTHENTDITIDVIDLLQALTDTEDNQEWATELRILVSSLVEHNALELLVQQLGHMDESSDEEATAVFNTLAVLDNMIDVMPEVAEMAVEKTKLSC
eukprot:evm.model.scf_992.4 EVM.evm.TU.scf_992.4   scf_992:19988-22393(-)